jgi:hypothetical protein
MMLFHVIALDDVNFKEQIVFRITSDNTLMHRPIYLSIYGKAATYTQDNTNTE